MVQYARLSDFQAKTYWWELTSELVFQFSKKRNFVYWTYSQFPSELHTL